MNDWSRVNAWGIYHRRRERAWAEYDPRLLWRPCDEIDTVLRRVASEIVYDRMGRIV